MARILEVLNQAEGKPGSIPESVLTLHAGSPGAEPVDEPREGPVPFIEVGGPRKIIDASPEVLAATPPCLRLTPAVPDEKTFAPRPPAESPPHPCPSPPGGERGAVFSPLSPVGRERGAVSLSPASGTRSGGDGATASSLSPVEGERGRSEGVIASSLSPVEGERGRGEGVDIGLKSVTFRPLVAGPGRFAPELVAFHQPDHPLSEGYRALFAGIAAQLAADRPRVVLFTAPSAGVGTTTVLLNVAITAARQAGSRALVVDANGGRPAVAARLGLPAAPGLREVLAGSASLPQALRETAQENLLALTAGQPGADGTVRLVVEAMPLVLRLLREQFPLVFVDGPPGEGPEMAVLASACDAVYLVVEQTRADAPEIATLLRTLRQQGGPLCGCVLTEW
ncbi:MAG TPA: CpsD/CapB family tyrosine-protein kinase [Gemmataceae bacterium]|nr:CpsD/CapB family tyrosine-protein kinase [Gemmataceae bacterium]